MAKRFSDTHAPAARPTIWAALLLAIYLSVPVFVVLTLIELWLAGR